MNTPSSIVTLEAIAQKTGVPAHRFSYIRKIYEDNRHNPTLLFQELKSPTLSELEVASIMAYIGAVMVGRAVDSKLYRPDTLWFSKTSCHVSQS
jgi:hypothetical protein